MRSVFYGTKRTIISDNTTPHIYLCSTKYFKTKSSYNFIQIPVNISSHNIAEEINYFIDKILKNEKVEMDEVEGSKTVASCLGAVISAREKKKFTKYKDKKQLLFFSTLKTLNSGEDAFTEFLIYNY